MERQNVIAHPAEDGILVEPPTISFSRAVSLEAEEAAAILAKAPPGRRIRLAEELLEAGAAAEALRRANVTAQLFERSVVTLGESLKADLAGIIQRGGHAVEERVLQALHRHEKDVLEWTTRYIDPTSSDGLPAIAAKSLRQVSHEAIQQMGRLLADGDEGPLGRAVERLVRQVQESERNILAQLVRKQTLQGTGWQRGRTFEEAVSAKLSQLALVVGCQVERCSDRLGTKRTKHGDHLVTLDPATTRGETVRLVIEEKSVDEEHRFSYEAVLRECERARSNREAAAAVFIAESRQCLPDVVAFGQVGPADFFVEFDPATGDDTGLVAAFYLARAAALQRVLALDPERVDRAAARRLIDEIRSLMERRSRVDSYHATATKAIGNASRVLLEDTEAVLARIAKLDALLAA